MVERVASSPTAGPRAAGWRSEVREEEYVAAPYRAYTPGDTVLPVMIAGDIPCIGSRQIDFYL